MQSASENDRRPGNVPLLGELVEVNDVGAAAAFLATLQARRMTGTILPVDAGLSIMG